MVETAFHKLFEIDKLPTKVIFLFCAISAFLLFVPCHIQKLIHTEDLSQENGTFIGLIFSITLCWLFINMTLWAVTRINSKYKIHKNKERKLETVNHCLDRLDPNEKAILREFSIQRQHNILLPMDNPAVSGLLQSGVLETIGDYEESNIIGILRSTRISDTAKSMLSHSHLGLSSSNPSEQEWRLAMQSRPIFILQIERMTNPTL